jgi:hypothetical protein
MRDPMNRSTTTMRAISSPNGTSRGVARGGRWYCGGHSRRSASRTVSRHVQVDGNSFGGLPLGS